VRECCDRAPVEKSGLPLRCSGGARDSRGDEAEAILRTFLGEIRCFNSARRRALRQRLSALLQSVVPIGPTPGDTGDDAALPEAGHLSAGNGGHFGFIIRPTRNFTSAHPGRLPGFTVTPPSIVICCAAMRSLLRLRAEGREKAQAVRI